MDFFSTLCMSVCWYLESFIPKMCIYSVHVYKMYVDFLITKVESDYVELVCFLLAKGFPNFKGSQVSNKFTG